MGIIKLEKLLKFLCIIFSLAYIINMNKGETVNKRLQLNKDYELLKSFVEISRIRISYGKLLARYKWTQGLVVFDENRIRVVIEAIERGFKRLNTSFQYDEYLFFVDLMEGVKVFDYCLYSDWYLNDTSEGKPSEKMFSLHCARDKMTALRIEMIKLFPKVKKFQYMKSCSVIVSKAIHEVAGVKELYLNALQRTFGNFCKKLTKHKPK